MEVVWSITFPGAVHLAEPGHPVKEQSKPTHPAWHLRPDVRPWDSFCPLLYLSEADYIALPGFRLMMLPSGALRICLPGQRLYRGSRSRESGNAGCIMIRGLV